MKLNQRKQKFAVQSTDSVEIGKKMSCVYFQLMLDFNMNGYSISMAN